MTHRQSLSGALVAFCCNGYIVPRKAELAIIALALFDFKILSACYKHVEYPF
jgi:hypothetical protein